MRNRNILREVTGRAGEARTATCDNKSSVLVTGGGSAVDRGRVGDCMAQLRALRHAITRVSCLLIWPASAVDRGRIGDCMAQLRSKHYDMR